MDTIDISAVLHIIEDKFILDYGEYYYILSQNIVKYKEKPIIRTALDGIYFYSVVEKVDGKVYVFDRYSNKLYVINNDDIKQYNVKISLTKLKKYFIDFSVMEEETEVFGVKELLSEISKK